jgi:hypothetical protein
MIERARQVRPGFLDPIEPGIPGRRSAALFSLFFIYFF